MAKSHPAPLIENGMPRYPHWARSFFLLAGLVSLSIIPHNQYGSRLSAAVMVPLGALELPQPVEVVRTAEPDTDKYRAVGEYLAHRYRVSPEIATTIVTKA